MNKTIWKYEISSIETTLLSVPASADLLDIQAQSNTVVAWFLVDPTEDKEVRKFEAFMTGRDVCGSHNERLTFLKTIQLDGGSYVVHVFEVNKK